MIQIIPRTKDLVEAVDSQTKIVVAKAVRVDPQNHWCIYSLVDVPDVTMKVMLPVAIVKSHVGDYYYPENHQRRLVLNFLKGIV